MYTGELIENLIDDVETAELKAFIKVTEVKRPAHAQPLSTTYIYELARSQTAIGVHPWL